MKQRANQKRPGTFASMVSILLWPARKLRSLLEKCVPLGYEDESGFHTDAGDSLQN